MHHDTSRTREDSSSHNIFWSEASPFPESVKGTDPHRLSSTCGLQCLPDHESSQQNGSDVEELDTKGLSGAHRFCLLTFDWLELSHMTAPQELLGHAVFSWVPLPSGIFTAFLGEHQFLVDS